MEKQPEEEKEPKGFLEHWDKKVKAMTNEQLIKAYQNRQVSPGAEIGDLGLEWLNCLGEELQERGLGYYVV